MDKNTQIHIHEINRLMNYDRSKTLLEQGEFKSVYGPTWGDSRRMKPSEFVDASEKFVKDRSDFISEYKHEILDVLAIGTLFIPVIGPFVSLGIDLTNAAIYYNEGDKEMAGLVAALSIIPGGEIARRFPAVEKYGVKFITEALSKTKAGKPITAYEKEAIKEFTEQSANGALSKSAKKAFRNTFKHAVQKKLSTLSLPQKIGVLYNYAMTYPGTKLASVIIQVGGISLTYYKLAEYFGLTNEPSNEEMMKKISEEWDNDEQIQKDIVDSLLGMDDEQATEAFATFFEVPTETSNKKQTSNWPEKFGCVPKHKDASPYENKDGSVSYVINGERFFNNGRKYGKDKKMVNYTCQDKTFVGNNKPEGQNSEGGSKSIPQNIIDGVMKKGYLIRKGIHSQESKYPGMMKAIEFIQKLVGAKVDGKFGPETESKVKEWQKSNGLKDDGIVGKNTLNKILENS